MCQMVVTEVKLQSPILGAPSISSSVHQHTVSQTIWGMHLQHLTTAWTWALEEEELSISIMEMKAVQLILEAFKSRTIEEDLVLMSDSATVVAYLKKQGRTISGTAHNRLVRATHSVHLSKVHPREIEHSVRPSESTRSGHANRIVTTHYFPGCLMTSAGSLVDLFMTGDYETSHLHTYSGSHCIETGCLLKPLGNLRI